MELLIGRDSGTSRLSITIDGKKKAIYGDENSVPKSVSREHCKITIAGDTYKISNANPNNITYVNGRQIEQKSFNPQVDNITLGGGKYELNIADIIKAITPQTPQPPKVYPIEHLGRIWHNNHDNKLNYQIKERKTNAIRSATGLITTVSIVCAVIPSLENLRIPLLLIGVVVGIYFAIVTYNSSSKSVLYMDNLDKEFRKDYVCPNPDCHSFLSYNLPYDELLRRGTCPYCKSKLTSK